MRKPDFLYDFISAYHQHWTTEVRQEPNRAPHRQTLTSCQTEHLGSSVAEGQIKMLTHTVKV